MMRGLCLLIAMVVFCSIGHGAERPVILAHYMPWYAAKPVSPHWGWHWTMNHFDPETLIAGKPQLASHYTPLIGLYDSSDDAVLQAQLIQMKLAGIDGVIVDWYGLTDLFDYAQLHKNTLALITQAERLNMQFAICYEDQTITQLEKQGRLEGDRIAHAKNEIDWLLGNWMTRPGYVRHNGKPLLLSFGLGHLTDEEWTNVLSQTQDRLCYLSQNTKRTAARGAFDWPNPKRGLEAAREFRKRSAEWEVSMPVVYPRFVDIYADAGLHESYGRISDQQGRTFQLSLQNALACKAQFIQIATWNDWGEGTIVEPSVEYGYRDLEYLQQQLKQRDQLPKQVISRDLELGAQWLKACRNKQISEALTTEFLDAMANFDLASARQLLSQISQ